MGRVLLDTHPDMAAYLVSPVPTLLNYSGSWKLGWVLPYQHELQALGMKWVMECCQVLPGTVCA